MRTKVEMSTPPFGDRPRNLAHVFYEQYPGCRRMDFFCFLAHVLRATPRLSTNGLVLLFFPPDIWRPKYQKFNCEHKISGKQKNRSSTAGKGLVEHACQISGSYLQKTAWTLIGWMLNEFWAICLNQPVPVSCRPPVRPRTNLPSTCRRIILLSYLYFAPAIYSCLTPTFLLPSSYLPPVVLL